MLLRCMEELLFPTSFQKPLHLRIQSQKISQTRKYLLKLHILGGSSFKQHEIESPHLKRRWKKAEKSSVFLSSRLRTKDRCRQNVCHFCEPGRLLRDEEKNLGFLRKKQSRQ